VGNRQGIPLPGGGFCLSDLEETELLSGLNFLNYQQITYMQMNLVCVKVKLFLVQVIILMPVLAQGCFANTNLQGGQSGDKGINGLQGKSCPTRLLSDPRNSASKGIFDKDPEAGCSRKQPPYNIPANLDALHGLAAHPEQSNCQTLIFVSFSMPEASLKRLAQDVVREQANPCRPILVMRGLHQDSFIKTAEKIKGLGAPVDINPELFESCQVTAVPAFVLVDGGKPLFRLKGNVTLAFAREAFTQQGAQALAGERVTP
jgi:type-F conjugative transfer system pilin assembly protein TrbC